MSEKSGLLFFFGSFAAIAAANATTGFSFRIPSSYFSKLFLKQFGMTPKEFEKQNQATMIKNKMNSAEGVLS